MNKQPPKGPDARKRKDPPTSGNTSSNPQSNRPSPGGHPQNNNPRSHKRAKLQDARTIRAQPSDAALKGGELDLQAFLNARAFEIRALEAAMRRSKAASTTRAFQKVPRAMRRRTASHNVKRVPKRLRARAAREMADDNTPTVDARKRRPRTTRARIRAETAKRLRLLADRKRKRRAKKAAGAGSKDVDEVAATDVSTKTPTVHTRAARPKIRRNVPNEPPKPKSKFRKRQINKTWLPTHLWHAKRARMTPPKDPLWRFAIPLTPNDKCYRPTHRAAGDRGAVVWDMSYMSTIGVYGFADCIETVLTSLGLPRHLFTDKKHQRWRSGLRKQTGMLSKERNGVRRDIGPATIMWNPEKGPEDTAQGSSKAQDTAQKSSKVPRRKHRELLIRVHPSCFFELFNELTALAKRQSTPQLTVEDLRFEIGSIELVGPGSTEALLSILHPYHTDDPSSEEQQHAKVFRSLVGVTNPASLPPGALLAFSIMDPRLRHPPKRVRAAGDALETLSTWPITANNKPYGLFDRSARFQAGVLPTQKSLDRRKGAGPPGAELGITAADPPIPVILFASRPAPAGGQAQGSWTLMAPWKCILPVWYSLVKVPLSSGGNPRLGGLDELRQVAFEQGVPWFPGDFPGTDAGVEWELEQRVKRRADWERRPKGKRTAWESLDLGAGRKGEVGDGMACDFERLFGLPRDVPLTEKGAEEEEEIVVASGAEAEQMELDRPDNVGTATASSKSKPESAQQSVSRRSLAQVHRMSAAAFSALCNSAKPTVLPPPHHIVTVSLTFVGRGVAQPCARIYRLPTADPVVVLPSTQAEVPATPSQPGGGGAPALPADLRGQWLARLRGGAKSAAAAHPPPRRIPPGTDMATRKRLVAESILDPPGGPLPWPWESAAAKGADVGGGHHPPCPGEEDLVGFVTTGAYCLADGRGRAVGSVAVEGVLEALRFAEEEGRKGEGRLCVVRNAGESVGWLARWEVV